MRLELRVVPFEPEHVAQLRNYGGQEHLVAHVDERELSLLKDGGTAYSAFTIDGALIGCGGLIRATQFRAVAWALLARSTPRHFLALHNVVRRAIAGSPFARIEAYVDPKSPPAMRWVEALGFEIDRVYWPLFFPDGSGASVWAYTKGS